MAVACKAVESHVYIEQVLPFVADDGQRLYLCQVYSVEGKDAEHQRQAAFLMRQGENEVCLVRLLEGTQKVGFVGFAYYKKPCEVVLAGVAAGLYVAVLVDVSA